MHSRQFFLCYSLMAKILLSPWGCAGRCNSYFLAFDKVQHTALLDKLPFFYDFRSLCCKLCTCIKSFLSDRLNTVPVETHYCFSFIFSSTSFHTKNYANYRCLHASIQYTRQLFISGHTKYLRLKLETSSSIHVPLAIWLQKRWDILSEFEHIFHSFISIPFTFLKDYISNNRLTWVWNLTQNTIQFSLSNSGHYSTGVKFGDQHLFCKHFHRL